MKRKKKSIVAERDGEVLALFASRSDAACLLNLSPNSMMYRVEHGSVVDGVLFRETNQWESDMMEMMEEKGRLRGRTLAKPAPKKQPEPEEELPPRVITKEGDLYLVPYEVNEARACITVCPFREDRPPMVGSFACARCGSHRSRDRKMQIVKCRSLKELPTHKEEK